MGLGKTIRELRKARGWTLEQLEERSGVASGTIHAIEARDSSRSQYFPALAKAFGYTMEQLPDLLIVDSAGKLHIIDMKSELLPDTQPDHSRNLEEETPMFSRGPARVSEPPAAPYGLQPILAWQHEDELPPGEYVMIPRLDVHLSAGNGTGSTQVQIQFDEAQPQAFRADWIRQQHLKPKKLAAMIATGDSMEPTIFDRDSLLIDTGQTTVQDGKVYALWYEGGERVKRLYRLPGGGLRIKSDNPQYGTIELGPDYIGHVRIIGRVVHRSGTGGL